MNLKVFFHNDSRTSFAQTTALSHRNCTLLTSNAESQERNVMVEVETIFNTIVNMNTIKEIQIEWIFKSRIKKSCCYHVKDQIYNFLAEIIPLSYKT